MEDLFIIAGLGNPGKQYEHTRHNIGFDTVDFLAQKYHIQVTKSKFKALTGEGEISGKRVLLLKPQTYMNLSGESIREAVEWYKVSMANTLIVYDDIDLATGKVRIRPKGSAGSHNGMKSILYQLQSDAFPRVRIGIGKPPEGWDLANYVLSKFKDEEKNILREGLERSADAVTAIIQMGIDQAMNQYNRSGN